MSYVDDIINVAGSYMIPNRTEMLNTELDEVQEQMNEASSTLYSMEKLNNSLSALSPISDEFGTLLDEEIAQLKKIENDLTDRFLELKRKVRT